MIEKRVVRDLHFMEENALARAVQANGHRVAYEVNFVVARGKLDAEFRGHDARSTVRWVAGDPDFHGRYAAGLRITRSSSANAIYWPLEPPCAASSPSL